uniref:Condensin complex subunit 2 n=1 Tax=Bracon brevicornis TaxID=1563983 RepID=A0A6V7JNY3_9HYME
MDRRKSIMQQKDLSDGDGLSFRRRSMLQSTPPVAEPNSALVGQNDDSIERNNKRHPSSPTAATKSPINSRRSFNLGSINPLTGSQIVEGIVECFKLNSENKITKKNAYSLKMIDFMTYMVKNRDENMSNLQVASTSLDVSAKIYGLRVDVLHQETMDMAGNLHRGKENGNGTNNGNGDENDGCDDSTENDHHSQEKTKKKKRKGAHVLADLTSLCSEPEIIKLEPPRLGDGDFHTSDMLVQVTAPRHVGLGLGIHPYSDCFLDKPMQANEADQQNEKIAWSPIDIAETKKMGSIFEEFEFLNWNEDYILPELENTMAENDNSVIEEPMRFNLEASVHDDDDGYHNDNHNMYVNDYDAGGMSMGEEEVPAAAFGALPRRKPDHIVDFDELLSHANTADDYSFFDRQFPEIRCVANRNWGIRKAPQQLQANSHREAQRKGLARKNKNFVINFSEDIDEEIEAKYQELEKMKKLKSGEDKLNKRFKTFDDKYDLFKYETRPAETSFPRKERLDHEKNENHHEKINIDDYDNMNNSHHSELNMEENHEIAGDNDNRMSPDMFDEDDVAPSQGAFIGTNLVEAPKLTEKIYIPFSQRAKTLDMRHLKKCIWESVSSTRDDKENVNDQEAKVNNDEPKPFVDIYSHLPKKLSKNDAKELSFPIAFVSLLHLANEKTLKLTSVDNLTDVLVIKNSSR